MAVLKYGTIVTEIKGKVGGQVFQRGRTSFVFKNNNTTRRNATTSSRLNTFYISSMSQLWRTLSGEQRQQWIIYAPDWVFYDKFGQPYIGSGYQFFIALNINRLIAGGTVTNLPVPPISLTDVIVTSITATYPSTMLLTLSTPGLVLGRISVNASAQMSGGVESVNVPTKRILSTGLNQPSAISLISYYTAKFGALKKGSTIVFKTVQRGVSWAYPVKEQWFNVKVL